MAEASEKKFFGYKAVVGAFLVMFIVMGIGGTIGTFLPSLVKYSEWDLRTIGYFGTIHVLGNILFSFVAAKLVRTWGPKKLMGIALCCVIIFMLMFTMIVPGRQIITIVLIYTAVFILSIAIGFGTFAVCTAFVSKWFVEKRETMVGIVLSAAAFGASCWNILAGQLFRFMEFKSVYYVMCVISAVGGFLVMKFLIKTPDDVGQKPFGWENAEKIAAEKAAIAIPGVTKAVAVKSASFWMLFAAFICVCGAGAAFVAYGQAWWQANGFDRTVTASYYALYVLVGGLSLALAGKIVSKIRAAAFAAIIGMFFIAGLICQILLPGNPTSSMILLISICLGIAYPLNTSMPGLVTQSVFGPRESGSIQAQLQSSVYIGQFAYSLVVGQFLKSSAGFIGAWKFYIAAVAVWALLIIGAAVLSPYKPNKKA